MERVSALCREKRLTYREAAAELGRRGRNAQAINRRRIHARKELEEKKRIV